MRVFKDFDEIKSAVGSEVGVSDWVIVTQDRINRSLRRPETSSGFTST
jgi:hypothetical protein